MAKMSGDSEGSNCVFNSGTAGPGQMTKGVVFVTRNTDCIITQGGAALETPDA